MHEFDQITSGRLQSDARHCDAVYTTVDGIIVVLDQNLGAMSVTNDAEWVIEQLNEAMSLRNDWRVIYRDSDNLYDELKHRDGKFTGFGAIATSCLQEAIAKTKEGPSPPLLGPLTDNQ